MSQYALWLIDDPVAHYSVHAENLRIGEIRWSAMHASVLHLGEARYWLVHDEAAAVADAGGSLLARFLKILRLNRAYTLREDHTDLAQARRHWKPLRNHDWIEFRNFSDQAVLQVIPRGLFGGQIDLQRDGQKVGWMTIVGLLRNGVSLQCPGLDPAQAALLMLAVQRAWGNNPYAKVVEP